MQTQFITKCNNKKCKKRKECIRFADATGAIIEFQNICHKRNNYKWLWQKTKAIVKK